MSKNFYIILGAIIVLSVAGFLLWPMIFPDAPQPKSYHIGLMQFAPTVSENMDGFKLGMEDLGYLEGKNVRYIYRDANGDLALAKQYAEELTALKPDLIFVNTSPATAVVKEATKDTKTPVVFSMVADPLGAGFVASVESSGNNLTGTGCAYIDIAPKRLQILKEAVPSIKKVLVFYRPIDKSGGPATNAILEHASEIGVSVDAYQITTTDDIKNYLARLKPGDVDAIMDPADAMVTSTMDDLLIASRRLKIPLMMLSKGEAEKGALISYGVDYVDLGRQSAMIANQVLAGIPPQNIPFEQPRKFFMAVNLKTAQELGFNIPASILEKADLVIK